MLFNSLTFLYFFAVVVVVTQLLPRAAKNPFLLFAGFLFYMSWSPIYILLLLATAAVDYFVAQRMGALPTPSARRPWLIASLLFSLGSLGFFKYAGMFLGTLGTAAAWLGAAWRPPGWDIALPLGISFYTFETISYAVDVYRGELQPKRSFFQYLSFLMLFPKLIAGPIVRASELLDQIPGDRRFSHEQFVEALNLLCWGYVKKTLLADNFAPFIEQVYKHPAAHNRWMCLVAIYGYSMQVYFDFSAYTDIARGCAKLLGYELPKNFNQPYLATSVSDFWRRWHMTLSRWLRDYLYIPLGGNHGGRVGTYRNLFLTMLLGGLWHGANWTFVAWGALNGLFLLGERAFYDLRGARPPRLSDMGFWDRLWRRVVVFHLITFTRIFFRAPTFGVALDMLRAVASPATRAAEPSVALFLIPLTILAYVTVAPWKERLLRWATPKGPRLLGYAAVLWLLFVLGASNAEFIYFQF